MQFSSLASSKLLAALLCLALGAACSSPPLASPAPPPAAGTTRTEETAMQQLFSYHQRLQTMSALELARERGILLATVPSPLAHLRLALVLAQTHGTGELARAQSLLEQVLRATTPAALELHAAARAFAAEFQERNRLELQNERLREQLNQTQRRSEELQGKLDAIADIERALPPRPGAPSPASAPR